MNQIALMSVMVAVGAVLAGLIGASMAVVAACAGAAAGSLVFAALRKNQVSGAFIGAGMVVAVYMIMVAGNGFKVRCDFGDPVDLPPKQHPAGYVYVIQDVDISGFYKIGRTINPRDRLNKFSVELPFSTEIVAIVATDDAPTLEWQLQQRYADSRKRGEWFDLSRDHVREICRI